MTEEVYCERMAIVLEVITQAARNGQVCPANEVLRRKSGHGSCGTVAKCINELIDMGCLDAVRRGAGRVFYVPAIQRATADWHTDLQPMVERAAVVFDTTTRDILSDSRFREHIRARWAIMVTAFELGHGYAPIGRALGRTHDTVMYGIDQAYLLAARDLAFRNRLTRLQSHFLPQEALAA